MRCILVLLAASLLTGCGSPVTLSGSYETKEGATFTQSASFTLPAQKGYAK